ncbi:cation acetate symporter, partial [Rhizobiaceae sp. 2RAB30]
MGDHGGLRGKLDRTFLLYGTGFVAMVLLLAMLSAIGIPDRVIAPLLIGFTLVAFAVIGLANRTMLAGDYFIAGHNVPAVYNGMATAAGWISAGGFLGLAGSFYLLGQDGLALLLGWAGGFVLAGVLLAPYLRRSDALTVPDFLAARYGSGSVRLVGVVVLLSCCFLLAAAQLHAAGLVAGLVLGIDADSAIYAGLSV